jgi:hypothetical protein
MRGTASNTRKEEKIYCAEDSQVTSARPSGKGRLEAM